jgi:glucose/arabinose dehydrogenase
VITVRGKIGNPMIHRLQLLSLCLVANGLAWQQGASKLPPPNVAPAPPNPPKIIARPEGAEVRLPKGFAIEEFAAGFARPRFMAVGPGGEILLSDFVPNGSVWVLAGKQQKKLLENLDRPYGIAFWKDFVYVAETTSLKRYPYDARTMTAGAGQELVSMKGMGTGHVTRTVLFNRKGDKMYLAVGSSANVVTGDPEMRAAINRYNPDGGGHEVVAGGLRNPVGLRLYPGTDEIWASVEERDGLGDDLVPDYFTHIREGGFYGWPYSYLGANLDPRITEEHKELVGRAIVPDLILQPHVAVLDFLFYSGKQFPAEYRNGAFLANHGSSGRAQRLGYSISFVPFKNGKPSGPVRDFATGWMLAPDKAEVWGRPVGLLEMPDGSLLLSDDGGKKVWRISYRAN